MTSMEPTGHASRANACQVRDKHPVTGAGIPCLAVPVAEMVVAMPAVGGLVTEQTVRVCRHHGDRIAEDQDNRVIAARKWRPA